MIFVKDCSPHSLEPVHTPLHIQPPLSHSLGQLIAPPDTASQLLSLTSTEFQVVTTAIAVINVVMEREAKIFNECDVAEVVVVVVVCLT